MSKTSKSKKRVSPFFYTPPKLLGMARAVRRGPHPHTELQNNCSPHATPASTVMDTHYTLLGLVKKWDKNRVLRLCGLLRITRYELASLIALSHDDMETYLRQGVFPGPICLLLTLVENSTVREFILDPIVESEEDSLFPFPHG